jgi:phosphatidylglycerol:prolipoprotein diacylglycerol transferase
MRQVLYRIPTDTPWIWLGVLVFVGLGFVVWLMSRKPDELADRRRLPLYLIGGAIVGVIAVMLISENVKSGIPIYGYGLMLFFAFVICTWLAGVRAAQEGVDKAVIQDLAIWLFIGGLAGSRIAFLREQPDSKVQTLWDYVSQFPRIWDGGVIFYGAAIGGAIGYLLAYYFMLRKLDMTSWNLADIRAPGISNWPEVGRFIGATRKLADIVAPSIAVGLCLGRIGCLLNGCCYGTVACPSCPAITFPLSAPARYTLVERGYQSPAGFTVAPDLMTFRGVIVDSVEAGSQAEAQGLERGDLILAVGDTEIQDPTGFAKQLDESKWTRGQERLELTVQKPGEGETTVTLVPRTLGLHPTQIYESISMFLLFLLLSAYYPFRRRDGEVMALLMICYGVHRYLNEQLRGDVRPVGFELYSSIILFAVGVALLIWLWTQPAQYRTGTGATPKTA